MALRAGMKATAPADARRELSLVCRSPQPWTRSSGETRRLARTNSSLAIAGAPREGLQLPYSGTRRLSVVTASNAPAFATPQRRACLAQADQTIWRGRLQHRHRGLWLTVSTSDLYPLREPLQRHMHSFQQSGQFGPRHGIILTDGRKFKSLRRHLSTLGMTPE